MRSYVVEGEGRVNGIRENEYVYSVNSYINKKFKYENSVRSIRGVDMVYLLMGWGKFCYIIFITL